MHSPFAKRQAFTSTSTMIEVFMQEKQPVVTASTTVPAPPSSPLPSKANPVPQMSPGSSDNQSSSPQPAQQKLKQQKKKASLTSKVQGLPGVRSLVCGVMEEGSAFQGSKGKPGGCEPGVGDADVVLRAAAPGGK